MSEEFEWECEKCGEIFSTKKECDVHEKTHGKLRYLMYFLGSATLFFIRYVPFIKPETADEVFSIDSLYSSCNQWYGQIIEGCNLIKPLNISLVVLSIILLGYGIYKVVK